MATSQTRFKCIDDKLINLRKRLQRFKSSMEFINCDSNADKVKSYEDVMKSLAKICEDEPEDTEKQKKNRNGTNKKKIFSCLRE